MLFNSQFFVKMFVMININSKQRKILEKYANKIEPVVIVGASGISDGVTEKVNNSLESHELIKIKFNDFKDEKRLLTENLLGATDATLVRIIGNIAILYRPAKEQKDRKYEKELNRLA